MRSFHFLRSTSAWISAVILALLPIVVAADFGGVLWWTQYVAGAAILVAVMLAVPSLFAQEYTGLLRQHILLCPLYVWIAFAWFQTIPMNPRFVQSLSGGSHAAYTEWLEPFLSDAGLPSYFPISIAAEQSKHALAVLMLLAGVVWASSVVFLTRQRTSMLLSVIALGAAVHGAFGLLTTIYPNIQVFGADAGGSRFGSFVNRNNAALLLNFGLAASLGLLAWRLAALTGQEVDDPNFEYNDLLALVSDRDSVIGVVSAVVCIAGLLVCGSRGGLIACVGGLLLAFGWVRQSRGFRSIPVVFATVCACVALLVVPLNLDLKSIKRMEVFSGNDMSTVLRNGRIDHWQDGWQTAVAHLPGGSGLGTYAYAYLPFQQLSTGSWYQHADNLWLELFVEQGIPGILLAVVLLVISIRTLHRMIQSADPIDHGLRVTGWYMIGVILLSQLFDFGLIVPANLFLVASFVSVIVARGVITGTQDSAIVFRSAHVGLYPVGVAAIVIGTTMIGVLRLERDARVERIARWTTNTLKAEFSDQQVLTELAATIQDAPEARTSPVLLDVQCHVQYEQARLAEMLAAEPSSVEEGAEIYRSTGPIEKRLKWWSARKETPNSSPPPAGTTLEPIDELYRQVLLTSEESLRRLPLGLNARTWQLYLDFAYQDEQRSRATLGQLRRLYQRNPRMLIRLGNFAADSGAVEVAVDCWRSALEISPYWTSRVIQAVESHDQVELDSVLPSDPMVFRSVASHLTMSKEANHELMSRAVNEIACDQCTSMQEKSSCQQLAGDLTFALGRYEEAFEHYASALELTPADANLHLKYVRRLRDQNRRREALVAARRARSLMPNEMRFSRLIEQMAAADLEEIEGKQ